VIAIPPLLHGRLFGRRLLRSQLARRYFTPRRQLRVRAYSEVRQQGRARGPVHAGPALHEFFFTAGSLHTRASTFFIYDFSAAAFSYRARVLGLVLRGQIDWSSPRPRYEHGILVAMVLARLRLRQGVAPHRSAWRARRGARGTRRERCFVRHFVRRFFRRSSRDDGRV